MHLSVARPSGLSQRPADLYLGLIRHEKLFVIADTARAGSKSILAAPVRNVGRDNERHSTFRSQQSINAEGATKLAPKEAAENINVAAGDDRRNWLFWLAT